METKISCDCGTFVARLKSFPKDTPGRLMCYCDDCQAYVGKLGRTDVLDPYGGTEVVPVYPDDIEIIQGGSQLKCYRLSEHGTYRWAAACCNTPILNTRPNFPWAGIFHTAYNNQDKATLSRLGDIKCRIHGRYAKAGAPFPISQKIGFRDMLVVLPFVLKGKLLGKGKKSPLFEADGKTAISEPEILN